MFVKTISAQSKIALVYTPTFVMAILIEDLRVRTFKQLDDKAPKHCFKPQMFLTGFPTGFRKI